MFPNSVEEKTGGNAFLMATPNNTFQPVTQFWKEFDLEARRPQYDAHGMKIMENQEQSVKRRRQLAESTQSFRRSAESNVVSSVGELLKQYQQEIDRFEPFSCVTCHIIRRLCSLTIRAKYGERAFLDVYHALYEAPDPAAALQTATEMVSRVAELETEIRRQAQELAEYSAESEEIRNQDAILRRLEDKIRSLETELLAKDTARGVMRKVSPGDGDAK